ncbi:hypothetical protein [Chitinophaga sancti]|uniref:Uncharacterized protein n=1 Tax=Chitinophaga sancti TaxID=1004 RepID=A0A1K1PKU8_9BACT|nr:hypothetical protein [Chitinophaga sancti]WQD59485.1 hypothetical protein U0033_16455 [Chitinophaga sancti]WQG88381.1 hypothetical protein SR876_26015 [Chitinophaga sancti]SFW48099.1 hypothetical protein SAMN05661012_02062 [Chitinophaga sancti]
MFIDYQSAVLKDYERKKADNVLSNRLIQPTSAGLRDECYAVCKERHTIKDEKVLRDFFEKQESAKDYLIAINNHEVDKFKPLANFLKGQVRSTKPVNIELLAWLIDFKPRPWEHGKNYDNIEFGKVEEEIQPTVAVESIKGIDIPPLPYKSGKIKPATLLLILILVGAFGYIIWSIIFVPYHERCMYWAGDHYVPVSCNQQFRDTIAIAYDPLKMENFRRITTPDTITTNAIGRVWYYKENNILEYYTADGYHPVKNYKKLKPLTAYIISKYIHPN